MPAVLRQIGPSFQRKDGTWVKPKAIIKTCIGCGFEGAMFGGIYQGKREWFCGWDGSSPVCQRRGQNVTERGSQPKDALSDGNPQGAGLFGDV